MLLHTGKEKSEQEGTCECVRTTFTRKESYMKMVDDWAKTWTEENLKEWECDDKANMEEPEDYTPLDWNARVEFHRLARMKRGCKLHDQVDKELNEDPKKKYTSEEVRKITARVLARGMERQDWHTTTKEKQRE